MDLHEGEMVHGCRRDNKIWIWIQWDRSKFDAHPDTRMAFGYDLNLFYYAIVGTWLEMRHNLDGGDTQLRFGLV